MTQTRLVIRHHGLLHMRFESKREINEKTILTLILTFISDSYDTITVEELIFKALFLIDTPVRFHKFVILLTMQILSQFQFLSCRKPYFLLSYQCLS